MNLKERIAYYLASGLKASDVAEVTGCSPSYVSQLLKDSAFKEGVEKQMQNAPIAEDDSLTAKYQGLEHKIVNNMAIAVSGAELPHLTKALEVVARAQDMRERRKNPALNPVTNLQNIQVISVTLPTHALSAPQPLTLNERSEVVAIGNRPLAPMSAAGVKALFKEKSNVVEATFAQTEPISTEFQVTGS